MPMPKDEEDDLYEDDFDFVDDDDDELDAEVDEIDAESEEGDEGEAPAPKRRATKKAKKPAKKKAAAKRKAKKKTPKAAAESEETPDEEAADVGPSAPGEDAPSAQKEDEDTVDEFGRPEPAANYVVHVYEQGALKRTIDRDFTPEDAEAFATEYTRTAKPYRRFAVAGKKDTAPKKSLT